MNAIANNAPQWQYWTSTVLDIQAKSRAVEVADINADGKIDFAVGSGYGGANGNLSWYENKGDLVFEKHDLDVPTTASILKINVGDLDNANGLDLFATDYPGNAVYWLKNDGSFNFTRFTLPGSAPNGATGLDLADFDNDGDNDLVVTSQINHDYVYWYESDGLGGTTQKIAYDFQDNDGLYRVKADFIDADAYPDIVIDLWAEDIDGVIHPDLFWVKNNGNGTFNTATNSINPAGSPHSEHRRFDTADMNGDGTTDIVITSRQSNSFLLYENDGTGSFTEQIVDTRIEWNLADGVIANDIDNDGDMDAIVVAYDLVVLFENNGSGIFQYHELRRVDAFMVAVASADFDNNGLHEIIVVDLGNGEITLIRQFKAFSINENTLSVGSLVAQDIDIDTLTYSISGGPDNTKFSINSSNGALSFNVIPDFETPGDADQDNVYEIIVSVNDGSISAPLPVSITVTNIVESTSLTGSPATFIAEDANYNFQPALIPGEIKNPVFSISNKPPWATFDTVTGELSGTPTNDHVGTYNNIVITVSDGN